MQENTFLLHQKRKQKKNGQKEFYSLHQILRDHYFKGIELDARDAKHDSTFLHWLNYS